MELLPVKDPLDMALAGYNPMQVEEPDEDDPLEKALKAMDEQNRGVQTGPFAAQRTALQAAKNIPGDLMEAGEGALEALMNPIDTLQGIGNTLIGTGQKAARHIESAITGNEPRPKFDQEAYPDAIGAQIKENFGTPMDALNTIVENPVDTALMATPAMGPTALRGIDPINRAVQGVKGAAGAASTAAYKRAAGIPRSALDEGTDLAERATREGIEISPKGLTQTLDTRDALNDQLTAIVAAHPYRTPKHVVTKGLDDLMRDLEGGPHATREIAKVKQLKREFLQEFGDRRMITTEQLQRWKTKAYEKAYKREGSLDIEEATGPETKAIRDTARTSKEELEARVPGYKEVNKSWQTNAQMAPLIKKRIDQLQKTDMGLAKLIQNTIARPESWSKISIALRKLQDAGPTSNTMKALEKSLNSAELRAALALAGIHQQSLEQM